MISLNPQPVRAALVLGAFLVLNGACEAGHPAARGCKYHVHKAPPCHAGPVCFGCFWHPLPPPHLPVIQSQAIRSLPAEAEPLRMRLQVQVDEAPRPREPFRDQDADLPRDPLRRDWEPTQKSGGPGQKLHYLAERPEVAELMERFERIERRVELLLQKLEGQQWTDGLPELKQQSR